MDEKELSRFLDKFIPEPNCGCWLWTANANNQGYGMLNIRNVPRLAHRLSYEHYKGLIPEGLHIDHLCRVTYCVNPDHLEAVTRTENVRRGRVGDWQKAKTHCPQGHPYDGDNLRPVPERHEREKARGRVKAALNKERSAEYARKNAATLNAKKRERRAKARAEVRVPA